MVLVVVFNSLFKYMNFTSALSEYQREKTLKHPQKQILPHTCTALMAPNIQKQLQCLQLYIAGSWIYQW